MGTMNLFAAKLMESLWDFGDLQSEGDLQEVDEGNL